jgi:lysozyme
VDGIDVSIYQGTVDWNGVKGAGKVFAFIRASHGLAGPGADTNFVTNWHGAKAAGLVRGAYHYLTNDEDAVMQADLMVAQIMAGGGLAPDDLPPVLDAEDTASMQPASVAVQHMKDFLARVESKLGRRPMIYTAKFYFDYMGNPPDFVSYPLWVANYNVQCPIMPGGGWTEWKFWQYSSMGHVTGITPNVDLDHFNGTLADLVAFANPPMPDAGTTTPDAGTPPAMGESGGCSFVPGAR